MLPPQSVLLNMKCELCTETSTSSSDVYFNTLAQHFVALYSYGAASIFGSDIYSLNQMEKLKPVFLVADFVIAGT